MEIDPDKMKFIADKSAQISTAMLYQASDEELKAMMLQIQKELKQRENFHRIKLLDSMISDIRHFRNEFPNEEMYMIFEVDEDEVIDGEFSIPVHEILDYIAARGWHSE